MQKLKRLIYEAPEVETVDVYADAVICESVPGNGNLGDYSGEEFIW